MNTGGVQPSLRLAYGLAQPRAGAQGAPPARAAAVRDVAELSTGVAPEANGRSLRQHTPKVAALVAATVPSPRATPATNRPTAGEVLPMYTNPALNNAAATGVSLGRGLDVQA